MKHRSLSLALTLTSVAFGFLVAAGCHAKPAVKPDPEPQTGGLVACDLEVALVCAEGTTDGCGDSRTLFHACVPETETAGPACEQEIAKVCPDGQVDACLAKPQIAATHLCVTTAVAPVSQPHACPAGEAYFAPGCGSPDTTLEAEGCYASCAGGAACPSGFECSKVTTDPCFEQACDACGGESELCIPSA
jgi:hypothetical protein